MKSALVIVDAADPARTSAALAEAMRLQTQERFDLHLLNVQPGVSGHVAMFFGSDELQELQRTAGAEDLAPALALLRSHAVPCTSSVRVGRRAETIATVARERQCERIVLGGEGDAATFVGKVFGSLAQQVRELTRSSGNCRVIGA
jgi:nucleotide-binding universal stress UspA family protein